MPETINTTDSIKSLLEELNNNTPLTTELLNLTWAPTWINNVTRLNAQNLQEKLYGCLKANYTNASNTTVKLAYEQIQRVLNFVAGVRSDPQSTSEVHNNYPRFEHTNNQANGKFQTVFGLGNETSTTDAQFILGTYADSTVENSLFIVGIGTAKKEDNDQENITRENAVVIKTDGTTTFYKDVTIPTLILDTLKATKVTADEITSKVIHITGVIPDENSDDYAVNKAFVTKAIADVNAISIRNVDDTPIEATVATVQDVATKYIADNYKNRAPKNLDGLIITITDGPSKKDDRILFVYSDITKAWINAGINDVDLSNFYIKDQVYSKEETYSKEEIDAMLEWQNW